MTDAKLPKLHACPHCAEPQPVMVSETLTRTFYFCLACGKKFEQRSEKSAGKQEPT